MLDFDEDFFIKIDLSEVLNMINNNIKVAVVSNFDEICVKLKNIYKAPYIFSNPLSRLYCLSLR